MKTEVQQKKLEYKVTKETLTEELKAAIAEFFVGVCEKEEEGLILSLINGQKFRICVEEKL